MADPFADMPDIRYRGTDPFADMRAVTYKARPPAEPPTTARERARALIVGGANFIPGMDEAKAAVRGAWRATGDEEYGPAYQDELRKAREELERVKRRTPGGYYGGQAATALLTAPLIPGGAAPTLAGRVAGGAAAGGATAAAQGFGEGEGGVGPRVAEAAKQGTTGAALGGVLAPVTSAIGTAGRKAMDFLGDTFTPEKAARHTIGKAIREEGLDLETEIARANAYGNKGVTVADVSPRASDLMRDVTGSPNPAQTAAKDFLATRQKGIPVAGAVTHGGQLNRLTETLTDLGGVGRRRALPSLRELETEQAATANDLFRRAERFDVASSPELREAWRDLLNTPAAAEVKRKIADRWNYKYKGKVKMPNIDDPNATPDFRVLKMAKETLDEEVTNLYKRGDPSVAKEAKDFRNQFRNTLRTVNPVYGEALERFSGSEALQNAINEGRKIMRLKPEEIAPKLAELGTESERKAFKIGAFSELTDTMKPKTPGEMTDYAGKFQSPEMRDRVYALLPDEQARMLFDARFGIERKMSKTVGATGGSMTQPRAQVDADVRVPVPEGIPGPIDMLMLGARKTGQALTAGKRGAMGRQLMRTDADALRLLEELQAPRAPVPRSPGTLGKVAAAQLAGPVELDPLNLLGDEQKRRLGLLGGR